MASPIKRKVGDTTPLVAQLTSKRRPLDIAGATVRFILKPYVRGVGNEVDTTLTIVQVGAGATAVDKGVVRWSPAPGDVDEPGKCRAEFEVTWGDGTVQTFPQEGYQIIDFIGDLG